MTGWEKICVCLLQNCILTKQIISSKKAVLTPSCLDSYPFVNSQFLASLWFFALSCFSNIFSLVWRSQSWLFVAWNKGVLTLKINEYYTSNGMCKVKGASFVSVPTTKLSSALNNQNWFFSPSYLLLSWRDKISPAVSKFVAAKV